jgi:tetratricopeptide (TPR) repeat protein
MARATFAAEKGEKELAEKSYDACIERFPTDGIVVTGVLDYFDAMGRYERSQQTLEHALELMPDAPAYRNMLALRLAGANKIDEAEAVLRAGIDAAPPAAAADAWSAVASFNLDHGDLDDAVAAYARARELDKTGDPQLLLGYADALVLAKRFDEAAKVIEQIQVPAHRILLQGRLELERGNPAEALRLFDEGMRLWPNNAVARYSTAIAAERLGNFERAIEEYRYAMRVDVNETDAYLRLARLQEAAGRYEGALGTLQFEPGGRPDELAAALLELRIQARLLPEKKAREFIRGALAEPEHRGAAVAALGEGVRDRSGPKASLAAMRAVPSIDLSDPLEVDALAAIVEDLAATGSAKDGLALAEAGVRKHADSAQLLAVRGRALELSGAPVASVRESFERALELDAKCGRALVGLARVEAGAGAKEAALALYDRALAADEHDAAAARESAAVLVALGRSDEAEARLANLIAERAYDAAAARALAELRLARGVKDDRTLELARRAVTFNGGAEAKALLEKIEPRADQAAASPTSG